MASKREDLQTFLEGVLGSTNVYYQPPSNDTMKYPAIVYERKDILNVFADNIVYSQQHSYSLTVLDFDPDSEIVDRISILPTCEFDRHYVADNLNHDVFILIY